MGFQGLINGTWGINDYWTSASSNAYQLSGMQISVGPQPEPAPVAPKTAVDWLRDRVAEICALAPEFA